MDDTERVIGALQEAQKHNDRRFDALEQKVEQLWGWRWMILGGASTAAAIVGLVTQFLMK